MACEEPHPDSDATAMAMIRNLLMTILRKG
jgi:hypothetical protein